MDLQDNQYKAYQLLVAICWITGILTFLTSLFIWVPITVSVKRKLQQNEKTNSEGIMVLVFTLSFFWLLFIFTPMGIFAAIWLMDNHK
ncbi:hypothetical protein [Spiroplasma eriocheiris]|uniref:Uncharacterized protein n=1 Tax=Spiroplasma eriocheiris TaxID=315358 RepID=A0A0H3XK86_9MOLU|nr:hypothetical protein [Spiroplasma eriocheiris]AHF57314.1 hypothetical protein SPE_0180 [Spiroplasma eriocheiris CCTCC M 207170]AKM53774.1 hypothetical protein SERIO_v1c01810 [Spiroplasma eriocheiris]